MTTFTDLGLAAPLLKALATENYEIPTPVQAQSIPHLLAGKDLLGVAQTGTGKTAAFALPILHRLDADRKDTPRRSCRTLILTPTRELAGQINDSFRTYGRNLRLSTMVVYGGVSIGKQTRDLANGVDILVATPGRLLDLINQRAFQLGSVEIFVLDEADQMLDMGFIHDIRKLAAMVPAKRQTMLFSATMPKDIAELAAKFLRDPVKVEVTPVATTAERVEQKIIFVDTARKQQLLHVLLDDKTIDKALVFTRTKHGADRVVRRLEEIGVRAAAIHGNKSQPQRERALQDFKAGKMRLLVATDIAARGIDIDLVSHVINYDLPNVPESYVHRIGRTARAGAAGIAISFCDREERAYLRDIERVTRQKVPVIESPLGEGTGMPVERAMDEDRRPASRGPGGRPAQHARPRPNGQRPSNAPHQPRRDERAKDGQAARPARTEAGAPKRWTSGVSDPTAERRFEPRGRNRS